MIDNYVSNVMRTALSTRLRFEDRVLAAKMKTLARHLAKTPLATIPKKKEIGNV